MGFTFKVETRKLPALRKRLDKLNGTEIDVGFFEEDRYGPENGNLPVAQVAYFNEFGTTLNPTRPFMRETFEDSSLQQIAAKMMRMVFESALSNGRAVERLMKQIGQHVAQQMKDNIQNYPGSNSPKTIKRKGGRNTPLRDTHFMMNSVKFKITRK